MARRSACICADLPGVGIIAPNAPIASSQEVFSDPGSTPGEFPASCARFENEEGRARKALSRANAPGRGGVGGKGAGGAGWAGVPLPQRARQAGEGRRGRGEGGVGKGQGEGRGKGSWALAGLRAPRGGRRRPGRG